MKPIYLEFCGVNSFSERAEIDFRDLLQYGIFGIFGDTGSGKSTILDCIGFALYGATSRSRTGSIADMINEAADKAYVNFEFEIVYEGEPRIFLVERELKRKNAAQTVRVFERRGEKLLALKEGVRESNELLERVIGLNQRDFEKCIALPQGEFAQFVKSARADRLKLISRLFDLEEYGERLTKKVNAHYAEHVKQEEILRARLEPFAEVSEAEIGRLQEEIGQLDEREKALNKALLAAREEERRIAALLERKREAERVFSRLKQLEEEREEIGILERELSKSESAASVMRAAEEMRRAEESAVKSTQARAAAEETALLSEQKMQRIAAWDEEAADEEIARLTDRRAKAEAANLVIKRRQEAEDKLLKARTAYAEEAKNYRDFSYDAEREKIEARLQALGEGDLFSFAEKQCKAGFMRSEYAAFSEELTALTRDHAEIKEDTLPLIEKYRRLSEGEKKDFAQVREEYELRERQRAEEQQRLIQLERINSSYRVHLEKLQRLQTEGVALKEEIGALQAQTPEVSLEQAERDLAQKKAQKRERAQARESAMREHSAAASSLAAAREREKAALTERERAAKRLTEALRAGDFRGEEEARSLTEKFGDVPKAKERCARFREEYAAVKGRAAELKGCDLSPTEQSLSTAKQALAEAESAANECGRALALKRDELSRRTQELERKRELEKEHSRLVKQKDIYERLKKLLEGNKFMEFAAEEYLQNIAANASGRLLSLTGGRYFLRYENGFFVGDNFNGGKLRGVYTLSGGETFLVSLSLALSLSAEICARSFRPIEFFFLDEGFGTLDAHLVDTVMDSLEKLKSEHFSIGLISHVEELKHRVVRKLTLIKATERHGSRIIAE